jgi:hypothetical protein
MRYRAMSSHEFVEAKSLRKIIMMLFILRKKRKSFNKLLRVALILYASKVLECPSDLEPLERPIHMHITVGSFTSSNCKSFFRFNKEDLLEMIHELELPEWCYFSNRSKMRGEEVFLRGIYELVSGATKHIICETVFGREWSAQSRAFTYFINFMYERYKHLVINNLDWWYRNGFFKASSDAIQEKMLSNGYSRDAPFFYKIVFFIDCNCLPTSRVGGGPAEEGANAARWDESIQRAFYNGWKSIHGLKHQTVDNAYGVTVDICGPTSLRRNDLAVLRVSNINGRMAELQRDLEAPLQSQMFGDSIYLEQSHLKTYFHAADIEQRRWNSALKKFE